MNNGNEIKLNNDQGKNFSNFPSRLILKNIPENFSDDQLLDILKKNFENKLSEINIMKLEHKYNTKNNKICLVTCANLETRKNVVSFFQSFELVDPKGFKQKLSVIDSLYQNPTIKKEDKISNSISNCILLFLKKFYKI
jgi:hypothetical protein